jgi:hypothetical protein
VGVNVVLFGLGLRVGGWIEVQRKFLGYFPQLLKKYSNAHDRLHYSIDPYTMISPITILVRGGGSAASTRCLTSRSTTHDGWFSAPPFSAS